MRIKLIEELPMATTAELYQLSWVIDQLLADPRRIVQVRAQLHTGQKVQYLSWRRQVALGAGRRDPRRPRRGTRRGLQQGLQSAPAAIFTEPPNAPTSVVHTRDVELTRPSPPPEVAGRADFRVGNRVTFIDKNLQHRVGLIMRVNQQTATLDCDGQKWRVAFELLRLLVEV